MLQKLQARDLQDLKKQSTKFNVNDGLGLPSYALDMSNLSVFVGNFLRSFGFVTRDLLKEEVETKNGSKLTCYSSPEIAICGETEKGRVKLVSYTGCNQRLIQDVNDFVATEKGYSFFRKDNGFLIVQN
jgi:hypothetical protein